MNCQLFFLLKYLKSITNLVLNPPLFLSYPFLYSSLRKGMFWFLVSIKILLCEYPIPIEG